MSAMRVAAVAAAILVSAACSGSGGSDVGGDSSGSEALDRTVVKIDDGSLRGTVDGATRSFLGIPYAAPPTGARRWQPPAEPARWPGVRDATRAAAACPQTSSLISGGASGSGSSTEDCLYLNVTTPTAGTARRTLPEAGDAGKLPVMVWLHGGSFEHGAGADYGPTRLVAQGGVLVVTVNYRLGALGFLSMPELTAENAAAAGNYGLLDQQAALRWVRDNVAKFGGDPKNVTLFGESAGASSVCAQLVSPSARGLFAKAIAESGCALHGPTSAAAEQTARALATKLGCSGPTVLTCLRAKPATAIRDASPAGGIGLTYGPVSGGATLPLEVEDAFRTGRYDTSVPLLQGTNHDEGRLFILAAGLNRLGPETYPLAVQRAAGTAAAPRILAQYPLARYNNSTGDALAALITDSTFACPALRTDRSAAAHGKVYGYEFNDPDAPLPRIPGYPLRAAHAAELGYLFDLARLGTLPPAARPLSRQMLTYWTSFATDGDPNAGGVPRWSAFPAALQSLVPAGSRELPTASFSTDHHCSFWDSLGDLRLNG